MNEYLQRNQPLDMLVQRLHNELAKPSNPQDLSNNTRPFFNYSNGFSYANYEFPQDTTDRDHEWEEYAAMMRLPGFSPQGIPLSFNITNEADVGVDEAKFVQSFIAQDFVDPFVSYQANAGSNNATPFDVTATQQPFSFPASQKLPISELNENLQPEESKLIPQQVEQTTSAVTATQSTNEETEEKPVADLPEDRNTGVQSENKQTSVAAALNHVDKLAQSLEHATIEETKTHEYSKKHPATKSNKPKSWAQIANAKTGNAPAPPQPAIVATATITPVAPTVVPKAVEEKPKSPNKEESKKNQYNPTDFNVHPSNARFFVIKSYSEDDIHKSIKFGVWASTDSGNKKLDAAYRESHSRGPIYLFFSVNASGQFCGMAQMMSPLDYETRCEFWLQDKWKGLFKVKWIFLKDIPNNHLRHIRLENNENKPVTNSRDTQEIFFEPGKEMLRIFASYKSKTSILDDFSFYDKRQEQILGIKAAPNGVKDDDS